MPTRIVIVGDLPDRPDRGALLSELRLRAPQADWDWIQAEGIAFNLPAKPFARLLHELRQPSHVVPNKPIIVKLYDLNGKDRNQLHQVCPDPVLSPRTLVTAAGLIGWLLSPESGLFRDPVWRVSMRAAALLAVLAKLIRNKAWNKDKHGHQWVKEDDLLGQAPVMRPDLPRLYGEAEIIVGRAEGSLLLTKGNNQGKTPKGWSINTRFLPEVKRACAEGTLDPLRTAAGLQPLMVYIDADDENIVEVDDSILSERVLSICRDREQAGAW